MNPILLLAPGGVPHVSWLDGGSVFGAGCGAGRTDLASSTGVTATGAPVACVSDDGDVVAWPAADGLVHAARAVDGGWRALGAIAEAGDRVLGGADLLAVVTRTGSRVFRHSAAGMFVALAPIDGPGPETITRMLGDVPGLGWVQDGVVHLARLERGGWKLTAPVPGAPLAVPRTLAAWTLDHPEEHTDHLAYLGIDGRIHELWARPDGVWSHGVLVRRRHAPVGRPAGGSSRIGQHVVVRARDGVLHRAQRPGLGWSELEGVSPGGDSSIPGAMAMRAHGDGRAWVACGVGGGFHVFERCELGWRSLDGAWGQRPS